MKKITILLFSVLFFFNTNHCGTHDDEIELTAEEKKVFEQFTPVTLTYFFNYTHRDGWTQTTSRNFSHLDYVQSADPGSFTRNLHARTEINRETVTRQVPNERLLALLNKHSKSVD